MSSPGAASIIIWLNISKTTDDIPLWQYIRENTLYRPAPDFSTTQPQPPLRLMSFKWSPVQELLQFGNGIENFYYFMADALRR